MPLSVSSGGGSPKRTVAKRNRKRDIYNLTHGLEARVIEEKKDFKQFGTRSAMGVVLSVMKRMVELDVLRGFLLLMMVANHSPSPLRQITDQPIGFFSTAEAFVFISALLAGLVFQQRRDKLGFAAARAATLQRALRIYRAHLITLFVVFATSFRCM